MKLLIIGPLPNPITGVTIANQTFIKFIEESGIDFNYINTNSKKGITASQGTQFSFSKTIEFLSFYLSLHKVLSSNVIYITPGQTFYGVLKYAPFIILTSLLGKPFIFHLHGNYLGNEYDSLHGIKKKIFKYLISKASIGIALSESLRSNFKGLLPSSKVVVVENFVNNNLYQVKIEDKKSDKLRVLYLSNLMEEKGILDLLDALLILKDNKIDFTAIIAGEKENGIGELINNKLQNLTPEVTYLKTIKGEQKFEVLKESNVFVLPTFFKMEGQPISMLEAMATGNLIITTNQGGIPDIVNDKNAIFVSKKSPSDIAEKLTFISKNLNLLHNYAENNINDTKHRFTEEIFGNNLLNIIRLLKK